MLFATFNRFEIEMPEEAVEDIAVSGANDAAVAHWAPKVVRPATLTPEKLKAELAEYGAWDATELSDDAANWSRIVWIAAWNIKEERYLEKRYK